MPAGAKTEWQSEELQEGMVIRIPFMRGYAQYSMIIKTEPRVFEDRSGERKGSVIESKPLNDATVVRQIGRAHV